MSRNKCIAAPILTFIVTMATITTMVVANTAQEQLNARHEGKEYSRYKHSILSISRHKRSTPYHAQYVCPEWVWFKGCGHALGHATCAPCGLEGGGEGSFHIECKAEGIAPRICTPKYTPVCSRYESCKKCKSNRLSAYDYHGCSECPPGMTGGDCTTALQCKTTTGGTEYVGFHNQSASGNPCLNWVDYGSAGEVSAIRVRGVPKNYCRNPYTMRDVPWCYVMKGSNAVRENCNVPSCAGDRCANDNGGCDHTCINTQTSFNCLCDSGFQLESDKHSCSPCTDGTYGQNCQSACPENCKNTTCNHVTGNCNCEDGWRGDDCSQACMPTTWGPNCSMSCSEHCAGDTCNHVTGSCSCKDGYIGDLCVTACSPGSWGKHCTAACADGCDQSTCDHVTGACACREGWAGQQCTDECLRGWFGADCQESCPSNCANSTCDHVTGDCPSCIEGWKGRNCSTPIPGATQKLGHTTPSMNPGVIAAIIAVGLIILLSVLILAVFVRRRKTKEPLFVPPTELHSVSPEEENRYVDTSDLKFSKNPSDGVYSYADHRPSESEGAVGKSPSNKGEVYDYATPPCFIDSPPVPALRQQSEATDSQIYETPEPVDPLRLRTSNNSVIYQTPGGVRRARVSADSNKDTIYSNIESEDPNAEDYYKMPSNVSANEYENPSDLIRRGDIDVNEYEIPDDLRRSNPGVGHDSNGYFMMGDNGVPQPGVGADEKGYFRMGSNDMAPIGSPPKTPSRNVNQPFHSPEGSPQKGLGTDELGYFRMDSQDMASMGSPPEPPKRNIAPSGTNEEGYFVMGNQGNEHPPSRNTQLDFDDSIYQSIEDITGGGTYI